MKVTEKYKQTEVGLIPSDWEIKSLDEVGKFSKGSGVKKDESLSGDIPCIRYGEIYTKHSDYIKQFYSFISEEVSNTAKRLKKGDILFAGSGETKEEIGKSVAFINEFEAYAGGDIVILTNSNAEPLFLGYLLNAPLIQKQKASRGQGDAVVHISATQLGAIKIPLPPTKAEQTAIATALSDADALISSLEKLIAKKRNIKQGAMQKLLQPKEGWEVKKLGDVVEIRKGQLITDNTRVNGNIPVIAGGKAPAYYHNKANRNGKTITISGSGASAGYVAFHNYPIFASDCSTIEEHKNYSIEYVFYLMQLLQDKIYKMQTGGAQPHIHPSDLNPIEVSFPKKVKQEEIATILSDMDAEINALETKLEKYKKVKLGMMQNLLTGKIRLV
jgi:type I restriction enzyme S subunit